MLLTRNGRRKMHKLDIFLTILSGIMTGSFIYGEYGILDLSILGGIMGSIVYLGIMSKIWEKGYEKTQA